ncbi:MAG: hypothetical protein A3H57_02210 [Candidatus Taylorbacteria bacterium RIFCSPLOWO2_02_FULL_43_11]|uniref:Type II secretion system protein GspG C-terminal domain-containing protein n=1 Tax=Candidatus Taylorbacteria bacterium RIFCSPHIGHO2_02_FULL_43_32b TaxID=1802306 RepID=A0A1G2MDN4_9BACT|nr:MAG: hypothetical protein A2743_02340 [Candidatus Taylorbacteria bacterium RIFCSPHIGHO2_01_FULL_43_47]OHA22020.1 MAG: hypothetical protein A3C72_02000 [Candidatus Taylorbacteria bacterium RIFCSPHIGHO2_02_FULL_43_32b]OHA28760.1 MAG: hypothetical protein A3B08_01175 [Candidatus Taylorbacteria bacterium RIFCSPLOWO2_01_FULL_43_44]OHA35491.1 MAG: hypothetical protein A3H57_02210 [Candidatus Taylorbacteria bacterium RIFCSPLOWO2_02_FULL_43_11]
MKKINKKGFTLIEILVVIGIIAILAAVVLVAINPSRQFKQASDSQRTANVNAILNAIGQYSVDNKGAIPAGIPVAPAVAIEITQAICNLLVPTYLPALPTDPKSTANGSSIQCAAVAANAVKYQVQQDTLGRVTVSAPETELAATVISVTR